MVDLVPAFHDAEWCTVADTDDIKCLRDVELVMQFLIT